MKCKTNQSEWTTKCQQTTTIFFYFNFFFLGIIRHKWSIEGIQPGLCFSSSVSLSHSLYLTVQILFNIQSFVRSFWLTFVFERTKAIHQNIRSIEFQSDDFIGSQSFRMPFFHYYISLEKISISFQPRSFIFHSMFDVIISAIHS